MFSIFADLALNANPFRRDLARAKSDADQFVRQVERSGTQSAGAFSAIGKAASGSFTGARGAATGFFGYVTGQASRLGALMQGIGQGIGQAIFSTATSLAGRAIGFLKSSIIDLGSEFENAGARIQAFTKDASLTADIMAMVREEADKTPFAFQAMVESVGSLMPVARSSGLAIKDLLKEAEILAASNPLQGLQGASFALREAMSGDFTSIIERFDLSRSSINKWKAEGVSNIDIVRKAMAEMGLDYELVAKMGETLTGRWSTFKDTIDGLKRTFGAPTFELFKTWLIDIQALLNANKPALDAFATLWGERLATGLRVTVESARTLWPALVAVGGAVRDVTSALSPFGIVLASFTGGGGMSLDTFRAVVTLTADSLVTFVQALRGDWHGDAASGINSIVLSVGQLGTALRTGALNAVTSFKAGLATLGTVWSTVVEPLLVRAKVWGQNMMTMLANGIVAGLTFVRTGIATLGTIWTTTIQPVVTNALTWGRNIIVQLANGIITGATYVVTALSYVGGIIASWLMPHSPPKLLPELDKWGAAAATIYMNGWLQGDFSAFDELSAQLEGMLRSLSGVGLFPEEGIIPALLGSRTDLAAIIDQLRQGQVVTSEWLDKLVADAGPAGAAIRELVLDYADIARAQQDEARAQKEVDDAQRELTRTTKQIDAAQRDLNATTREYELRLRPLNAALEKVTRAQNELRNAQRVRSTGDTLADLSDPVLARLAQIDAERQAIDDAQRIAELTKTANETDDPAKKREALLEIEQIQLEAERRKVEAARAARDAGDLQKQAELDAEEAAIKAKIQGIEDERDKATEAIKDRIADLQLVQQAEQDILAVKNEALDSAKLVTEAAQKHYDIQKNLIDEQKTSNKLVQDQIALLDQQAKAAAAAAAVGGAAAGGAGGGGGINPITPDKPPVPPAAGSTTATDTDMNRANAPAKYLRDLQRALDDLALKWDETRAKLSGKWAEVTTKWDEFTLKIDEAKKKLGELWDAFTLKVDAAKIKAGELWDALKPLRTWVAEQKDTVATWMTDTLIPTIDTAILRAQGLWAALNGTSPATTVGNLNEVAAGIERIGTSSTVVNESTWYADFVTNVGDMVSSAKPLLEDLAIGVEDNFNRMTNAVNRFKNEVLPKLGPAWQTVTTFVGLELVGLTTILSVAAFGWEHILATNSTNIKLIVSGAWAFISNVIGTTLTGITSLVSIGLSILGGDWDGAWAAMKKTSQEESEHIKDAFQGIVDFTTGLFSIGWALLPGIFKKPLDLMWSQMTTFRDNIFNVVNTIRSWVGLPALGATSTGQGAAEGTPPETVVPHAIPARARGDRNFQGGLALVGEEGPELAYIPQHSVIVPADITRQLLSGVVPGFAGGLNVPNIKDIFVNTPEWLLQRALDALGLQPPDLTGALAGGGQAFFAQVKRWLADAVKRFITEALPVTPKQVQAMIAEAEKHVGEPYTWGGGHGGAAGFDCSGFVAAILDAGGISNPHGIVTAFYEWMSKGRTGVVDIGIMNPYGSDREQHTGIGLLGQWYESGGRAGGVGRTSDYFPEVGHPPVLDTFMRARAPGALDHIDLEQSLANMQRGGVGQWSIFGNGGVIAETIYGYGAESGARYLLGEAGTEFVIPANLIPQVLNYFEEAITTGNASNRFLVGIPLELRARLQELVARYLGTQKIPNPHPAPGGGGTMTLDLPAPPIIFPPTTTGPTSPGPTTAGGGGGAAGGRGGAATLALELTDTILMPSGEKIVRTIVTDPIALADLTEGVTTVQARETEKILNPGGMIR